MIRIVNETHCQVLHRKAPHETMMEAIADIARIRPIEVLSVLLEFETLSLEAMLTVLPPDVAKHPKLTLLVLIAGEYSYFDGAYRRRKNCSTSGLEAYNKVKTFVGEYLSKL
jgi:hypothetical protein